MKKINYASVLIALLISTTITSQEKLNLSALFIPQELKENANAVVRSNELIITVAAVDELTVKQKRVITVFNKQGNTHVDAFERYNDDTKITKLSATVYNLLGKKIKKYSKSDFEDVSAIDGGTLYSDSRVKYLQYTPTSYPYTVVFESEYKNSSTGFIPKWFPIESSNLAIEKSTYIVNNPTNIPFRKREKNLDGYTIENTSTENNINYTLTKQKAIKPEYYSVNFEKLVPSISLTMEDFSVKGIRGKASNWTELGKWEYNTFYNEKHEVSEQTKSKILDLTKDISDPIEKAKKVYEYLQKKTRYINVSVGIGGLKPIESKTVDEVGYGDCKGLTNYTRALLKIAGVNSYFTEVFAGKKKKDMDIDFPQIQGNHVILNIPNEGKDIWLECTSQTMPFGFLGDFTDDRDVLVITPKGAILKRTPAYVNTDNLQLIKADIKLLPNENITASLERKSYGTQYDQKFQIENYTKKELDKYYKSHVWDYNNNLEIENIAHTNNKEKVEFIENIKVKIEGFATAKDSSYLFKLNVFNRITNIPKKYRKRQRPLEIDRGFTDRDEFTFTTPKGYVINSLPDNKNITNKFGLYSLSFKKIDDHSFVYKREFSLKKGVYPKEEYKAYRKFRKTVAKYDNLRTELIKQ